MIRKNFLGEKAEVKCVGCAIAEGEFSVPGGILLETEHFLLHQDPEYAIESFFIISAKRHFSFYSEMTEQENIDLAKLMHVTRGLLSDLGVAKEYTVIQEERSKHFHVWFFPRLKWMEDFPNSLSSVRDIMNFSKIYMEDSKNISKTMAAAEKMKKLCETVDL